MTIVGKLLGMATIGSTIINVNLIQKTLSGVVCVIALTIVSAFLVSMLLVASFFLLYFGLVHYGLEPAIALSCVALLALAITVGFVTAAALKLRELRDLPFHKIHRSVPAFSQIGDIIHSFINGLLNEPSRPKD